MLGFGAVVGFVLVMMFKAFVFSVAAVFVISIVLGLFVSRGGPKDRVKEAFDGAWDFTTQAAFFLFFAFGAVAILVILGRE